ncbi:Zn(2+)-responsive transcriptional regulator [Pseudoalteromonas tunicata]|uniref:Zinc-responsive transcriptional regulator n=1 Tax=Pseudoalteromonas tunicata D2 TaxID=87626 RepID=A4C9B4_9GAMM|nr:Zn(2+)-responsive transcriptional regulator [Pseudoalteromonas tunicata]ATC93683.1 MerR family transcriptional regulator, Zn(II)-responsive regulator of zntA [Pseudoalteromonas tunicata]AXT29512.1 Zn(2+)-responsive transcriptional regulator [Pseudoalteromonas tunicata]EAR29179.1 zinc-responsive transcriptional regulator [Pseudoalteromonas tunicata D2]MDP4983545.1 Zn(2+)-responsive transcriptional regulator [Pseudoalteromonas tunicata]MDP5211893.1 Zn(2+)-responsive transcriptional regulator 
MQIGELAKQLAVSTDTLRYYEKNQLLSASGRTDSGYRIYDAASVKQLEFVLRAKSVGFTLNEIKELLAIKVEKENHSCAEIKTFTADKMAEVAAKIAELQRFHQSLNLLHASCCGGEESAQHCSILSALENVDDTIN